MTLKRGIFAEQYALDQCGRAAAVRAGYAPNAARQTACELLAKPHVRARPEMRPLVAEHEVEAERSLGLTEEKAIAGLKAVVELPRAQGNPAAEIAEWREIAKMCGYYAPDRKQIELSDEHDGLRTQLEEMSATRVFTIVSSGSQGVSRTRARRPLPKSRAGCPTLLLWHRFPRVLLLPPI